MMAFVKWILTGDSSEAWFVRGFLFFGIVFPAALVVAALRSH